MATLASLIFPEAPVMMQGYDEPLETKNPQPVQLVNELGIHEDDGNENVALTAVEVDVKLPQETMHLNQLLAIKPVYP